MRILITTTSLFFFLSCLQEGTNPRDLTRPVHRNISPKTISEIELPAGYKRVELASHSFGEWLRKRALDSDKTVYLYNGEKKRDQSVQFAVLDISIGEADLQQCADAVMRLRAEYLYDQKRWTEIEFRDNNNKAYKWAGAGDRGTFNKYLKTVFGWCGSASLEKQLKPVEVFSEIQPGDVLIRGGFPGHAMIVSDVAINGEGKKIFLLAQSYMPAQSIHVVKNYQDKDAGPWYEVNDASMIVTPEWTFKKTELRRW